MSAQPQHNQMSQDIERELARRLDVAKSENKPAVVEIAGNLYRLVPIEGVNFTDVPATHYDPEKMRATIHAVAGTMRGVNRDELFADLRAERGQDSIGRPADE